MEPVVLWRWNALKATAVVALAACVLTGCETMNGTPKTAIGGLGGAAVGGLIAAAAGGGGTAIAASVIGGALVGGLAGNLLDERDQRMANETAQRALETAPSGKAVAWTNPDTGHSGTVTPVRTYESNGNFCREFQQTVTIGGRPENSFGTACRQPDGSWRIVG
jgi:surface antigen